MVRRTARMVYAADNWVFPGGRVDPGDHVEAFDTVCRGLTDHEASGQLGVERGGLAWWVAACRETLEEAGLLMAAGTGTGLDLTALRDRVRANEMAFIDLLLEHDVTLDVTAIEEVARFITPVGSPRRFDARFFVARTPHGQVAHFDDGEIVNLTWLEPAEAIEQWRAGEMTMMSPTRRMLSCLARYRSVDEVMAAARRRQPMHQVGVAEVDGEHRMVLPGERGYEWAEMETEKGWIRLWELPG
jgi:8-oxo-dGTP pyrophosphatase MutT (NUDIX family)